MWEKYILWKSIVFYVSKAKLKNDTMIWVPLCIWFDDVFANLKNPFSVILIKLL